MVALLHTAPVLIVTVKADPESELESKITSSALVGAAAAGVVLARSVYQLAVVALSH